MAHQIEKMMFVGETPWHGLGTKFTTAPSIEQAIKAAGLEWSVERVQLQMPNGEQVERWATVRSTDKKVLGTVGPGYHVLQNSEAFDFFQPFLDGGAATLETAGSLAGGSRVFILAKLNSKDEVIVKKADDRVAKFLLLAHGHDGSLSVHTGLTPVRVVCANTLAMVVHGGKGEAGRSVLKIKHTKSMEETLDAVQQSLKAADRAFEKTAEVYRALAATKPTNKQVRAYLEAVFGTPKKKAEAQARKAEAKAKAEKDGKAELASLLAKPVKVLGSKSEIEQQGAMAEKAVDRRRVADHIMEILEAGGRGLDLPGVKGTAWAVYNAVTEYANHERGSGSDARMSAVWFGDNTTRKMLPAAVSTFLKS